MKRSNRLVILVGVLLAALAFVAIVILLNQRPAGDGGQAEEVNEQVLVTIEDIELGEPLTPDKVEVREVPPDAVLGTPLRDPSQLNGRPALFPIAEGTQVTFETIGGGAGPENIAAQLQPGEKAIAVRLDPQTGVNFLAQPGDYVDVIISEEVVVVQQTADSLANPDAPPRFEEITGLDEGVRTVKTVLQDKRVLYVSGTSITPQAPPSDEETDGEEPPPPAAPVSIILVFAGTDQDAEVVKFHQRDASELSSERTEIPYSISVVIRNAEDDNIEDTTGITLDVLIEDYGVLVPNIVEQLNEEGPSDEGG